MAKAPYQIGQRTSNQEVFLHEAQRLADARGIIGIKHAGQGLGCQGFRKSAHEVASAEFLKIEIIRRRGGPQSQCIDVLASIADYRPVKRHSVEVRVTPGNRAERAVAQDEGTVQFDGYARVRASDLPGVRMA